MLTIPTMLLLNDDGNILDDDGDSLSVIRMTLVSMEPILLLLQSTPPIPVLVLLNDNDNDDNSMEDDNDDEISLPWLRSKNTAHDLILATIMLLSVSSLMLPVQ